MFLLVLGVMFLVGPRGREGVHHAADSMRLARSLQSPAARPAVEAVSAEGEEVRARVSVDGQASGGGAAPQPMAPEIADRASAVDGEKVEHATALDGMVTGAIPMERGGVRAKRLSTRGPAAPVSPERSVAAPVVASEVAPAVESPSFAMVDTLKEAKALSAPQPQALVFSQVRQGVPASVQAAPQQVLTLVGSDPAGLARRAVQVANSQGLPASLALAGDDGAATVEVYLNVPVAQYDGLMRDLSGITSPMTQSLSNSAAATGEFFRVAKLNYDAALARRQLRESRRTRTLGVLASKEAEKGTFPAVMGGRAGGAYRKRETATIDSSGDEATRRSVGALGVEEAQRAGEALTGVVKPDADAPARARRPVAEPMRGSPAGEDAVQDLKALPDRRLAAIGAVGAANGKQKVDEKLEDVYRYAKVEGDAMGRAAEPERQPISVVNLVIRIGTPEALMPRSE